MRIGVIGVGAIGGTIARRLAAGGHEVLVANSRGTDAVAPLAAEIGAIASDVHGAVRDAGAIIISIPFPAVRDLPRDLLATILAAVPVIDTGNYYPGLRDPNIPEIDAGMTESIWASRALGRPVCKAFNNITAESLAGLGRPAGAGNRIALPVAGDDAAHKSIALRLVDQVGFEGIDGGSLDESWRQQPGTPAYCTDHGEAGLRTALAMAVKGKGAEKRDYFLRNVATLLADSSVVAVQRRINTVD